MPGLQRSAGTNAIVSAPLALFFFSLSKKVRIFAFSNNKKTNKKHTIMKIAKYLLLFSMIFVLGCDGEPTIQNNPHKKLEQEIEKANKKCPVFLEEGIKTTKCYLEGENLVIEDEVDEVLYDINLIKKNQKENKPEIIEGLKNVIKTGSDPLITTCIVDNNKGIIYRYIGKTSGKKADIVISPDEL